MNPPMTPPSQVMPAAVSPPLCKEWKSASKSRAERYIQTKDAASSPSDFRMTAPGSFSANLRSRKPVKKQATTPRNTISP